MLFRVLEVQNKLIVLPVVVLYLPFFPLVW